MEQVGPRVSYPLPKLEQGGNTTITVQGPYGARFLTPTIIGEHLVVRCVGGDPSRLENHQLTFSHLNSTSDVKGVAAGWVHKGQDSFGIYHKAR